MKIVTIVILPCQSMLLAQLEGVVGHVEIVLPVKCMAAASNLFKNLENGGKLMRTLGVPPMSAHMNGCLYCRILNR